MQALLDAFMAIPELLSLAVVLAGVLILLLAAVWPLDPAAKPDPMADAFGDWPNIDPRL